VIANTDPSTAVSKPGESWALRELLTRHKWAAVGVSALVALMLAMVLVAVFGAKPGAVTDATSCTQWGSMNQARQAAYARLYVREHGPLRGFGAAPETIITAINDGCARAYADDVSDTVTVVQAISGNF
jgi:hypothetical protein